MSESEPPDRLARLGRRLDEARARRANAAPAPGSNDPAVQQGMALGLRIGVEFVVAIVVATALGWALDRWLGTKPWGTIALFFLGIGAGMVSVYRAVAGIKMAVGYRRSGKFDGTPDADRQRAKERAKDKWDDDEE
jgi:ATP synthase protein I